MVSLVGRYINEGQEVAITRKKRDFLNKTYHYTLEPSYGVICTVNSGSTSVTGFTATVTLPVTSTQEHKFYVVGSQTVYDVSSFNSTTINLASAFTGTTGSASSGIFFQSSVLLDTDIRSIHKVYHDLNGIPRLEMKGYEDIRDVIQKDPQRREYARYASQAGYDTQNVSGDLANMKRLLIYPYPLIGYTLHVDANIFIPLMVDATDEPIIPLQFRQLLYWYAMAKLGLFHQEADAYQAAMANFTMWLGKMDGEMFPLEDTPRLWIDNYRWQMRSGTRRRRIWYFDS